MNKPYMGYSAELQFKAKNIAKKKLSDKILDLNEYLLNKVHELFEKAEMNIRIEELHENLGYRYDERTDTITFGITIEELLILESIRDGNLIKLKKLNDNGHFFGAYKRINLQLACKFGHLEIIDYLINSKQINVYDINDIFGKVSNIGLLKNMFQKGIIDNLDIDDILKKSNWGPESFHKNEGLEGLTESDITS